MGEDFMKMVQQKVKENDALPKEPEKPKLETEALNCTFIHIIYSKEEIDSPAVTFAPEFLHHFIEDEIIRDYEDPKLHFYFTPLTMDCYFKAEFKSRQEGAPNLLSYFEDFFLNGLITDRAEFEKRLEEQKDFKVPAKKLSTLSRGKNKFDLYLADNILDEAFRKFLKNMQIYLKFFIENGSYIEDDDSMWKLLVMVENREDCLEEANPQQNGDSNGAVSKPVPNYACCPQTVVGFVSYYPFYQAFDSFRLRISQQIILPCYQRKGLGSHLIQVDRRLIIANIQSLSSRPQLH